MFLFIRKVADYPVTNRMLRLLMSYSSGREQYVKIGAAKSNFFDVTSGVGQGTILGPLWFTIFFNDSNADIPGVSYMNLADDKQIAVFVKTPEDTQKLQSAIDHLMAWCNNNELIVNRSKCKIITFTHKRSPIENNYTMGTQLVERVNELRCLGVKMDMKMNFISHMEHTITGFRETSNSLF